MQLLRVASTMSCQGSYSGPGDEYDFEDDGYDDLDEYRDRDDTLPAAPPVEDSDEGMFCLRSLSNPVLVSYFMKLHYTFVYVSI